jgi:hypothetical protein
LILSEIHKSKKFLGAIPSLANGSATAFSVTTVDVKSSGRATGSSLTAVGIPKVVVYERDSVRQFALPLTHCCSYVYCSECRHSCSSVVEVNGGLQRPQLGQLPIPCPGLVSGCSRPKLIRMWVYSVPSDSCSGKTITDLEIGVVTRVKNAGKVK